ncbi:MAG: AMP-binding protein [Pseudomonadota bacterium]
MQDLDQGPLECGNIFRLFAALLVEELQVQTGRSVSVEESAQWGPETRINEEGIGFDSLARIDFAVKLNKYFHLHEVGAEDYLLLKPTLGEWCEIIEHSLSIKSERITFHTSGSTGDPKPCTHHISALAQEVEFLASLFPNRKRLVAFVPAHHIFGFLFTVLLPQKLKLDVVDARGWGPGVWPKKIVSGDLIIATPYLWDGLAKMCDTFPGDLIGVTSTAPMPADLKSALQQKGLHNLFEIYGSSETAGVGYRTFDQTFYTLFPDWDRGNNARSLIKTIDGDGPQTMTLNDEITWHEGHEADKGNYFQVGKRNDNAIQIGGVNVFPDRVKVCLNEHPSISECVVRPMTRQGDEARKRLAAFIVLKEGCDDQELARRNITAYCQQHLSAPERPNHLTFGTQLPKNEFGKDIDWLSVRQQSNETLEF